MNISIRPEEIDLITNASMFESLVNAVVTANDTNHDLVDKLLDGCFGAIDIEIDCPCQGCCDQTEVPDSEDPEDGSVTDGDKSEDNESPAERQLHGMHDTDSVTPGVKTAPNQEVRREASPELYEELFSALWAMYNAGDCTDYVGLSDISPEAEARLLRFLTAKAKLPEAVKTRLFPAK